MAMTFDERLEMLQQASRGWLEFTRTLDRIPDEALLEPNTIGSWSGRDLLAHIASWEAYALEMIEQIEAGGTASWPEGPDAEVNARLLAPYQDASLDEVREQLRNTHFALMDAAERAQRITPDVVLDVTANHYAQHMDDLRRLAGRKRRR